MPRRKGVSRDGGVGPGMVRIQEDGLLCGAESPSNALSGLSHAAHRRRETSQECSGERDIQLIGKLICETGLNGAWKRSVTWMPELALSPHFERRLGVALGSKDETPECGTQAARLSGSTSCEVKLSLRLAAH